MKILRKPMVILMVVTDTRNLHTADTRKNQYFVETIHPEVLQKLLKDPVTSRLCIANKLISNLKLSVQKTNQ